MWMFPVILLCVLSLLAVLMGFAWLDARKRGKSPVLVTLLVISTFPVGLIAWLLFRPELPVNKHPQRKFDLENYRVQ